jgi:tripartite motif-containing protein 71
MPRGSQLALAFALVSSLASASCTERASGLPTAPQPSLLSITYVNAWGVKGTAPGQLQDPSAIAVDSVGDVFVTNFGNAYVNKFGGSTGTPLLSLQEDGMNHPDAVTVDDGGAFYVGDPVRDSVFIFKPEGDKLKELRLKTKPSDENRVSVAVGDNGFIYVLDSNAAKVFTFTPRAKLVQTWLPGAGAEGSATGRYGPIVGANDGFLYVGVSSGTVLKFTREGQRAAEIHPAANGVRWDPEPGFAIWSNHVFVMDADGHTLHVATLDGASALDADLAPQLGLGRRNAPILAVSAQGDLLVLDPLECRILRYHIKL